MLAAVLVFLVVTGAIVGAYALAMTGVRWFAGRRVEQRLREVSAPVLEQDDTTTVVARSESGPLPVVDQILARTQAGPRLTRLIEQSGVATSPGAVITMSVLSGALGALLGLVFGNPLVAVGGALLGVSVPFIWLTHKRKKRVNRFEEQFPEALDLLSRAIRAGHAFQSAMGMVAEEMPAPVGVEFKKAFDQQNFGLPLREALTELAGRVPSLDVRFFVTAVTIQRETGGNLTEILDNLGRVVRERFKIRRQVRVHTAHGRFTGYVLLGLPPALAMGLSYLNPDHMKPLFQEPVGQMMLIVALVMQTIGFVWIRQVIKIEV
jgi:tight adherence protein B